MPAQLPLLVVFWGFTATGKSYLARAWAASHHFAYFNTDVVRKQLAQGAGEGPSSALNKGIYRAEFTRQTYDLLIEKAVAALIDGPGGVVLDGSYLVADERTRLAVAMAGRADLRFVFCHCPEPVIQARLAMRAVDPDAVSDGSWAVYLEQKRHYQPPIELNKGQLLVLNTDAPLADLIAWLDKVLLEGEDKPSLDGG